MGFDLLYGVHTQWVQRAVGACAARFNCSFIGLMPKMAHTGECHGDTVFITRSYHFFVPL